MGLSSKQVIKRDGLDWISALPKKSPHSTAIIMRSSRQQQSQISNQAQSEPLICPRCDSSNTKFCYYNNYNKSQPRHFCRACKRHWTKGGTLRNVPVGGARKTKRSKKSSSASAAAAAASLDASQAKNIVSSGDGRGDKSMSEILYRAMSSSSSFAPQNESDNKSGTTIFGTASTLTLPFSAAGLFSGTSSPFESSLSSISNSFQTTAASASGRDCGCGDYSAAAMVAAQPPWQQLAGNGVDTPSYHWSFEDIDTLVSADDHFRLPWDDSLDVLKP